MAFWNKKEIKNIISDTKPSIDDIMFDTLKNMAISNGNDNFDVNQIINMQSSRIFRLSENPILNWRIALDNAEGVIIIDKQGNISGQSTYTELVRCYNEALLNDTVKQAIDIRKSFVLARDWKATKDGIVDDWATNFFEHKWFHQAINLIMDGKFESWKLIQLGDIVDDQLMDVKEVPQSNVHPKARKIINNPNSFQTGVFFEVSKLNLDRKPTEEELLVEENTIFIYENENKSYEGNLCDVIPYEIIARANRTSLLDYTNRFGSPNIIAKTDKISSAPYVQNLMRYMSNFWNRSFGVVGKEDDIQLVEATGKGSEIYVSAINDAQKCIQRLILGSTLTDEQAFVGSAALKADIANLYSLSDLENIEHYINNCFIPKLIAKGLTNLEGVKVTFDKSDKMDPQAEFQNVISLIQTGKWNITQKELKEKFNINMEPVVQAGELFPPNENSNDENV